MTKIFETPQQFADEYLRVLTAEVGKDLAGCTNTERYQALAKLIAQKANQQFAQSDSENAKSDKKKVYYFSLEFLLGPLLDNYLLNYGIRDVCGASDASPVWSAPSAGEAEPSACSCTAR